MVPFDPRLPAAWAHQRAAFDHRSLASPLYAAVVDALLGDIDAGGPTARVLAAMPAGIDPMADAVPLRLLGALHRVVLTGGAPDLARWYPTAGGRFDPADAPAADRLAAAVVAAVEAHEAALAAGLSQPVQTNEVGRCATLAVGFTELLRRFGRPLRLLEVGASAGLNLRWDRWRYEPAGSSWGDPSAALRFGTEVYRDPAPSVAAPLGPGEAVAERRGCDRSPIDAASEEGRVLLRSFVWPDQGERHERLAAALAAAAEVPATVDDADAGTWVGERLAEPAPGATTVVFHSIVWQYLPPASKARVAEAFASCPDDEPVAWLRMEPPEDPTEAAELRLAWRHRGLAEDRLLARSGYHGRPVWAAP